jgi:ring-1,2-phenylacetyl-CoA epoxidase subunit PaaC
MEALMEADLQNALADLLLSLGDDELALGQRLSEWCAHAPILEEDIAFANLALDELGHAALYYTALAELQGANVETYPDQLVFFRDWTDFRSLQMVELPNGDWAFTMLRQFLFDAYEKANLELLASSAYAPLVDIANRIRKEELYHYRHTKAWVLRLGGGTDESCRRLQAAAEGLWPYAQQMFSPLPGETLLVEAGYAPARSEIHAAWEALVVPVLNEAHLLLPTRSDTADPQADMLSDSTLSRQDHTPYLKTLVEEMQSVARLEPEADW